MKIILEKLKTKEHWKIIFKILLENKVCRPASRPPRLKILRKTLDYMPFTVENIIEIK